MMMIADITASGEVLRANKSCATISCATISCAKTSCVKTSRNLNVDKGFTLIEVVIAIFIFSVIGLGSASILNDVLTAKDKTDAHAAQLKELQRGMSIIARDIEQIVQRSVRDEFGDRQKSLVASNPDAVEFSKIGWTISPFSKKRRSQIQRVRYSMEEGALVRSHWDVLDRGGDTDPENLVLISGVTDLRFRFLKMGPNQGSQWLDTWPPGAPPLDPENTPKFIPDPMPVVVEMNIETERFGKLKRLFRLVSEQPVVVDKNQQPGN